MLYIARENIEKAYFIQSGFSRESNIKESYYGIYWLEVLKMQNEVSDASIHSKPIIWVLSVFITFIAEYMFFGKKEDGSQTGR